MDITYLILGNILFLALAVTYIVFLLLDRKEEKREERRHERELRRKYNEGLRDGRYEWLLK